ncbi:Ribosomal protein S12 methylthiotransferase accessory factor YcaO [Halorhabdus sp. SVX81]|uniref:YcaO-like family protein n=1 Tax=Halorhabdus sp. SVX81 TaxID=2978283 RepID=UPI0023D9F37E|nr:YcaO-like family protein [Halorhabdus sp. SVX81]WEL17803.1 Ribosomal protein S12 methylthiotransferase accessory factor YcaO [Halorhabdus sp. SVX81]
MSVGLVGAGPAVEAVESALGDVDSAVSTCEPDEIEDYDLGIVVDVAGAGTFERANERALETEASWIAIELGGVGGVPVVDAAITGFGPETACYECLRKRVRANVDPAEEPTEAPPPTTARFAGAIAGRVAASTLDRSVDAPEVFGFVTEIPDATRRLLPVPHCTCGTEPSRTIERTAVDRDLEATIARAEQGLDDRLGIVQEVGEIESFPAPYYLARNGDTDGFSDVSSTGPAAGVDVNWNAALMKALGEAYERYSAGVYRRESFRTATIEELARPIAPSSFVTPEPPGDGPYDWIEGQDLATGQGVQVPASVTVYPPSDDRFRPANTTGLGFGNAMVEALLSGLYEVIERDASMLSWYSTFEPLELDVSDDRFETLARRVNVEGLSVTPLLLTQDIDVPVVAVAVHRADGEWPRFALGSSANLDPAAAARSALAEAVQNWFELRQMGPDGAVDASGAIGDYATFPDVVADFVDAAGTVPAADVAPDAPDDGGEALSAVVERVTDAGLSPYAVRLTPRDIEAIGFEAVRVLVPSAQPLFLGDPYFGERLETVPDRLGFEARPDRAFHPFP